MSIERGDRVTVGPRLDDPPPARDVPAGMWYDVCQVLAAWGLEPSAVEVMMAVKGLVDRTPPEQGGRQGEPPPSRVGAGTCGAFRVEQATGRLVICGLIGPHDMRHVGRYATDGAPAVEDHQPPEGWI